jgi:hypothetical protein
VGEQEWKIKIFILAVILELVYQLTVFRWIYPLESLVVAAILALLPYLLLRGAGEPNSPQVWQDGNKAEPGQSHGPNR